MEYITVFLKKIINKGSDTACHTCFGSTLKVDIKIHIYILMYNITLSFVPHYIVGLFCKFCRLHCTEQVSHLKWESFVSHVRIDCHYTNTEQAEAG